MSTRVASRREPTDIRLMRSCLQHWPFPRGKGVLLRVFEPRLRDRDFLMEVEPGILIPAKLDDYMSLWCFLGEQKKDAAFQLSQSLIRPGDTVIDAGANIGLWVMGAARRASREGKSYAFEPVPANFSSLTSNLRLNGLDQQVRCEQLGLSDKCGAAIIYATSNGNSGGAALAQRVGVDKPIDITLTTLDRYCEAQEIDRVDFLKVDIEGAELLVFRGATRVLASPQAPAIVFEVSDKLAISFNSSATIVKEFLHLHGYDIFRYDGKRLQQVALDENHEYEDLFAFKPYHFQKYLTLNSLLAQ